MGMKLKSGMGGLKKSGGWARFSGDGEGCEGGWVTVLVLVKGLGEREEGMKSGYGGLGCGDEEEREEREKEDGMMKSEEREGKGTGTSRAISNETASQEDEPSSSLQPESPEEPEGV
ncbi:uncharacterized protein G2W53_041916 [Senna tora]|uniref:Uncharacterized protein n=1 Tax=Senna tora TaxID=362788 RepID=A0A834VZJ4_9FABA|nr:uncharacterized protein G2W53_041916 [Senna tora]